MASSKVLLVFLIIAAGYFFVSNYTLTKGAIARTNGQHLYLKSAIYGIIFLIITAIFFGDSTETKHSFFSENLPKPLVENLGSLTTTALKSFFFSCVFLALLETPIKISNLIGPDLAIDRLLEKRFKSLIANKLMMLIEGAWLTTQIISSIYARKVELLSLRNNQVDITVWEAIISDDEILMVCDDHGKVFIGFPLQVPDPKQTIEEKTIKMVPVMSGALCNEFHNLHITTDYTENTDPYNTDTTNAEEDESEGLEYISPSPAVLIYTQKIKYLRKFDIDMFESFFRKRVCACGNDIYQPRPNHQKVPLYTSSQTS
ncbi:hypothetical protein ACJ7V3_12050 [Halomonas elongata]|uniref:hypothetical protein n=1 Tax=Halomonas elongata TaxID=2746 RepID=UPI0038D4B066